jgi:hypothetical protein
MSMLVAVVSVLVTFVACTGGDDDRFISNDLKGGSCEPGTVRSCFGPRMCIGKQTCLPNGKGYNACLCMGKGPNVSDAATDGPTSNADAASDGPTSNADAASDGPTSNADAASDGPTSNGDASDDGPTSGDASDADTRPNLVIPGPPPNAADDAPR